MKFSEWKAKTMVFLISLTEKYKDNSKALSDLNFLITKLQNLRSRDIASFLYYCHIVIRDTKISELIQIIPNQNEIIEILKEES